jgi:Lipocalin-like domain
VPIDLTGTWRLVEWRRVGDDGTVTHPLGDDAHGLLIYAPDGRMAVQMAALNRPSLPTADPLGGDAGLRADAYSTCLAYFGSYEVEDGTVVHRIDMSLYPNWSGEEQRRPFTYENGQLILRTPPAAGPSGTVVNEIVWIREEG